MILINSSPKDALKTFQPFLPIYVPIGLGSLLAVTEKEDIKTYFIDEQVEDHVCEKVNSYIQNLPKPYIFGFSVLTAAYKRALEISKKLKQAYPDSLICFGGVHPTAMPEEVLSHDHIDFVIRGEGEASLPKLYRCIKSGRSWLDIDGLSYKHNGKIFHNESAPIIDDLDALPGFPYHLFDSPRYDLGFIVSSRGCPHKCIFCSNRITTGKRYRFKSTEAVIDEMALLYSRYGRKHLLFLDDNLLVSKKRIYRLMDGIREKGLHRKMTFSFQARGDNVDHQLLCDMFENGFKSVFFGMETASESIMKTIRKGETVEQCVQAVRMAKAIGFHVSATFIYALPGDTHENRMDCARMSRKLELDMVRFNNATPYPGTELFEIAKKEKRLKIDGIYENFNSVSTFIENPFKKIPFSYVPQGNTEREIRWDILFSYFCFYLNADKLKRILTKPDDGVGWFSAGNKVTETIRKLPALFFLGGIMSVKFGELLANILFNSQYKISALKLLKELSTSPDSIERQK